MGTRRWITTQPGLDIEYGQRSDFRPCRQRRATSNFTVQVTDSTPPTPQTATKPLQLIIGAAPPTLTIITPAGNSLPSGSVGSAYNTSLDAAGGTGAQSWSIRSGTLPNGLSLNPSTGAITGTPQVGSNGTTSLTVRVQDSGTPQQSAKKLLSITIGLPAPPNITTTSLPAGTFNVAYNQTISVTGGIGTLVWGVTSGALPPGLNLNPSNGDISGTPTTSGSFQFTVRVTDSIPRIRPTEFHDHHQLSNSAIDHNIVTPCWHGEPAILQYSINSHWRYTTVFVVSESCLAERSYIQSVVRRHQRNTTQWK